MHGKSAHYCIVAALLSASSATADVAVLEELVVSAARIDEARDELAIAMSRLDSEALRLTAHSHVSEAMFQVPGGWISRGNGQEHLTALRSPVFTGAGACGAFLMTEDLIPLRAAGFCNINQLFDANTEQAERIEVIRGPGSAIYGSNAMHGVINVITPRADADASNRVTMESGPHDYLRGKISASTALGEHALGVHGNLTHDGGYKDDSGFDQAKLTLRHAYQGEQWRLDSGLSAVRLDQDTAGFIRGDKAYRDSSRRRENPNPDAYRDVEAVRAWSRFSRQIGDAQLLLTPYLRWNEMEFLQHFLIWQPRERNGHWSAGLQASYHRSLDQQGLSFVAGLDLEHTDGWLKETQDEPFSSSIPAGRHYDYQVDGLMLAPFAQLQWQWRDDTRLETSLRFEHNGYDYDNRLDDGSACAPEVDNCRFFRPADGDDDFNEWSPRVAIFHDLGEDHGLWLGMTRGFRAPQATELYRLQNGQQEARLDPVRLDSLELGYRGRFGAASLELVGFVMAKQDFIFQDSDRQNLSGGESRHEGIELAWRQELGEHWRLALTGTWARHQYDNDIDIAGGSIDGNDMDTAPRTLGRAALQWLYRQDSIAELEVVHIGDYYLDPSNSRQYEGHELLSLRVRHQLTPRWLVSARVTNLTDTEYADRADFAFGSERYFVGEPRSLYVGIEAVW